MCRRVVVWRVVCARSYAVVSMAVSVTRLSALTGCECGVVVAVCAVACLSVRVSPSRGGDVAYPSVSCDVVVCCVVSCRAVFVSCFVGFDTPRDASVCNGLRGVVPYLICTPSWECV